MLRQLRAGLRHSSSPFSRIRLSVRGGKLDANPPCPFPSRQADWPGECKSMAVCTHDLSCSDIEISRNSFLLGRRAMSVKSASGPMLRAYETNQEPLRTSAFPPFAKHEEGVQVAACMRYMANELHRGFFQHRSSTWYSHSNYS